MQQCTSERHISVGTNLHILFDNTIEQLIVFIAGCTYNNINVLSPDLNWEEDVPHCHHLSLFATRTPSSILSRLFVLSWWSPLDAMDLRLISRHHSICVSSCENYSVLIVSLFCRDGAGRDIQFTTWWPARDQCPCHSCSAYFNWKLFLSSL